MPRDYYEALGVSNTASDDEIKKAWEAGLAEQEKTVQPTQGN